MINTWDKHSVKTIPQKPAAPLAAKLLNPKICSELT